MSNFLKYINETVKKNPWKMIFISAISSGLVVMLLLPNLPQQIYSLVLFPLSAGSFAAILTWLFNEYRERAQLNFFAPTGGSFFFPHIEEDNYSAPYRLVVYLRISNHSPLPISLSQFDLEISNYKTLHSPIHVNPLEEYTTYVQEVSAIEEQGNKIPIKQFLLKPILTLAPYQAAEGYLFFPMCPEIKEDTVESTLIITTTRGEYKLSIPISRSEFEKNSL